MLQDSDLITLEEIHEKLSNHELSTIRYAIRRLLEAKIILSVPELMDMRTVKYRLNSKSGLRDALSQLSPDIVNDLEDYLNSELDKNSQTQ